MARLKIGEVAARLGVTISALRFYEKQGVVTPQRSEGGTRYYLPEDIERFRAVLDLAEAGVPIKVIRQLSGIRGRHGSGDAASREVARTIAVLKRQVAEKRALFSRVERDLDKALQQVEGCFGCQNPPTPEGCGGGCPVAGVLTEGGGASVFKVIWEQRRGGSGLADAID